MRLDQGHIGVHRRRHIRGGFEGDFVFTFYRFCPECLQDFGACFQRNQDPSVFPARDGQGHRFAYVVFFFVCLEAQHGCGFAEIVVHVVTFVPGRSDVDESSRTVATFGITNPDHVTAPGAGFETPGCFPFGVGVYRSGLYRANVLPRVVVGFVFLVLIPPPAPFYLVQTNREATATDGFAIFIHIYQADGIGLAHLKLWTAVFVFWNFHTRITGIRRVFHRNVVGAEVATFFKHPGLERCGQHARCQVFFQQSGADIGFAFAIQYIVKNDPWFGFGQLARWIVKDVAGVFGETRVGFPQLDFYNGLQTTSG